MAGSIETRLRVTFGVVSSGRFGWIHGTLAEALVLLGVIIFTLGAS